LGLLFGAQFISPVDKKGVAFDSLILWLSIYRAKSRTKNGKINIYNYLSSLYYFNLE